MSTITQRVRIEAMKLTGVAALAALAALAVPGEARACGGLFCNARPPDPFAPLPVAQNGENVVFSIVKDPAGGAPTIQAHIQILYTGDAAKFSWVVPVDAEPKLGTGTDRLFTALAQVTTPRYQPIYATSGTCIQPVQTAQDAGVFPSGTGSAGTSGSAGTGGGVGGVQVSFQGAVGPFDAAVIKSDDPVALKKWLTDNGYIVTDAASALIDDYVRENKFFVALKLLNGLGVRSIQPIVMTFRGTEACVPLRLTAIAANPDMPVLVWVLGTSRVAPRAFYELKIDEARINWTQGGGNYFGPKGLLSEAANEAGGKAFITEYAGQSSIARSLVYPNGLMVDLAQLRTAMIPPIYVQRLIQMGLANDPLTLGLLAKYIPMPDAVKAMNITESQFYGNLQTYWNQFAFPPYDLAGLTDAIDTSILKPRVAAQAMIDASPYLTRLNTFISPEEMDKDPFFFESEDLPDLSNAHTATIRTMCGDKQYMACNAPVRLELQDGRMIWLRAGVKATTCQGKGYAFDDLKVLPAAETVWEREVMGEGNQVISNTAKIMAGLEAHNRMFPTESEQFPMPPDMVGAGGSTGTGAAGTGAAGSSGVTGKAGTSGSSDGGAGAGLRNGEGGCGCALADGGDGFSWLALAAALGVALSRGFGRARRAPRR